MILEDYASGQPPGTYTLSPMAVDNTFYPANGSAEISEAYYNDGQHGEYTSQSKGQMAIIDQGGNRYNTIDYDQRSAKQSRQRSGAYQTGPPRPVGLLVPGQQGPPRGSIPGQFNNNRNQNTIDYPVGPSGGTGQDIYGSDQLTLVKAKPPRQVSNYQF